MQVWAVEINTTSLVVMCSLYQSTQFLHCKTQRPCLRELADPGFGKHSLQRSIVSAQRIKLSLQCGDDPGEQFSSKKEEVGAHLLIQSPNISGTPSFAHLFMSSFLFKWCLSISNKYTLGRIKKIPTVKD